MSPQRLSHKAPAEDLADQLGILARSLEHAGGLPQTLDAIVHAAVAMVPGCEHASISQVLRRREVFTVASTDDLPIAVDQVQYETAQGPCLDTLFERRTAWLPDLTTEKRWPEFSRRAAELGARSMLSLQLFVVGEDLGALNLLSEHVDAFDDESEQVGRLFATHSAIAMAGARLGEQLRASADTRNIIGQAQGVLMERFNISSDRAFEVLVRHSQGTNRKLRDIAYELVTTRKLPCV